jgi:hypothetical protein
VHAAGGRVSMRPCPTWLMTTGDYSFGISPAPRAHLYFAPKTATGISVEYA